MPIPVACSGCGKRFKAPDKGAGKKVPCPACKTPIAIPEVLHPEDEDDYKLEEPAPKPRAAAVKPEARAKEPGPSLARQASIGKEAGPSPARRASAAPARWPAPAAQPEERPAPAESETTNESAATAKPAWVPPTKSTTPPWLRHLHWWLALAMIPLAISIFVPDETEEELNARLLRSLASAEGADEPAAGPAAARPEADAPAAGGESSSDTGGVEAGIDEGDGGEFSEELLFALLPGHKLQGALLARDSFVHWFFAIAAVVAYLLFLIFLASDKAAHPLHLIGLGLFTATGGILLLLMVQGLATMGVIRARGIAGLIMLILTLIGLSYSMALDPETGFFLSFIGFTCGVGLCEELCKAMPLLIYYRIGNQQSWRGAFLWGLASGVGFGVSEGIMYSSSYYNGIAGLGIYVVRFVSCVALHAIWAGSVGIAINQRQYLLQEEGDEGEGWWLFALAALRVIAIPMILHGLYDTLLKKEMQFFALLTAAASFGYLAWQISRLRTDDDEDERAAYVAKYIRSKVAAARA